MLQSCSAAWSPSSGLVVAERNWRGPGFRVVGVRRVDAQTGGAVSVRSALLGVLFDQVWQAVTRSLFRTQARQRRVGELYQANDVNPLAGCSWQLARAVISQLILALGSRRGRTFAIGLPARA
jgi:hypothetical protein